MSDFSLPVTSYQRPDHTDAGAPVLVWLSLNSSHSHRSLALPLLHGAVVDRAAEAGSASPWSWVPVTGTIHQSAFSLAARILAVRPRLVAATVYLFNRELVLKVLRRVKAVQPECTIVLGGPEFLSDNRCFLQSEKTTVNAVLRGEGETPLPLILNSLDSMEQWHQIPGLCWLDEAGRYHDNGLAVTPAELMESMPPPTSSEFFAYTGPFAAIETARGCFFRCAYCTSAAGGPVRTLSIAIVREMLHHLHAAEVREVRILDRTFNHDSQRCRELLDCLAEYASVMRFHIEVHPAFLDSGIRDSLRFFPAGRLHLEAGLQTGSDQGLRQCRRQGTAEQAWEGLEFLCRQNHLEVHVDVLAGLPGVTLEQTLLDLRRLLSLGPREIQLEVLKLLPGTELRERAADYSIIHAADPPYEVLQTGAITVAELRQARLLSRLIDDFYNEPQLQASLQKAVGLQGGSLFFRLLSRLSDADGDYLPRSLTHRYRIFHRVLSCDRDLSPAREWLEYQWLWNGHSPEKGIVASVPWKTALPPAAVLREGDESAVRQPGRIRQARIGSSDYWFIFPGGRQDRRAAAVYRRLSR